MIPFGELAPDVADLNTNVSSLAHNVTPGVNSYNPQKSLAAQSNALTNPSIGAVTLKDSTGNNYIYAGDKTKLYGIVGVTPTDYSKSGGYTDNSERWNFINWGENVIASKMGDTPQILALGGTTFADLTGTPPQGRTITTIRDFVVFGNTFDSTDGNVTNRVRWSGFNDETAWTVGTNQSDQQDIQGKGGAVKRVIGGEYGIVFQSRSIQRMTYVGTPLVFQFDEIEPSRGTSAAGSVVQYGSDIYYLAQDGFYVLRNGSVSDPIGMNKIDRWFLSNVNDSYLDNITSAVDPERGIVVWSYPSIASSSGVPDSLISYNYKSQRWATSSIDCQMVLQGASSAYTLEDLDAFGNMDTLTASLDNPIWQGGSFKLAAFNTDNKLSYFTGTNLAAEIETGEISTDNRLTRLTEVRPIVDGTTTVKVAHRSQLKNSMVETAYTSVDSSGKANFRTNARYHRITVKTSGDFEHAIGVEVKTKNSGKR